MTTETATPPRPNGRQQCGLCGSYLPIPTSDTLTCPKCGTESEVPLDYRYIPGHDGINGFGRHAHGTFIHQHDGGRNPHHDNPRHPRSLPMGAKP
jgi:hypothetical protein